MSKCPQRISLVSAPEQDVTTSLSPIENMVMTRYLRYKNKLNNIEDKRLPKIASKSSHNHHRLKRGWHKDTQYWINYWGIMEEADLGGYWWPPTFSDWLKTVLWQFWQFTIFSRF